MEDFKIRPIRFDDILPIWKTQLWPDRPGKIEPSSAMKIGGGYCMEYMEEKTYFWGAYNSANDCVGVVSGFETEPGYFRLRGLWVVPECRHQNIGPVLLEEVIKKAIQENCHMIWTMERKETFWFYLNHQFLCVGTTYDYEGGPHFWMLKKLSSPKKFPTLLKKIKNFYRKHLR